MLVSHPSLVLQEARLGLLGIVAETIECLAGLGLIGILAETP